MRKMANLKLLLILKLIANELVLAVAVVLWTSELGLQHAQLLFSSVNAIDKISPASNRLRSEGSRQGHGKVKPGVTARRRDQQLSRVVMYIRVNTKAIIDRHQLLLALHVTRPAMHAWRHEPDVTSHQWLFYVRAGAHPSFFGFAPPVWHDETKKIVTIITGKSL